MDQTPSPGMPAALAAWHRIAEARDPAGLDALLADDVVFRSPAVHTPQEGKAITTAYLTGAIVVLGPGLTYEHEWWDDHRAVLEFTSTVEGKTIHGVDMIDWEDAGRITRFTVMVRPYKGLQALMGAMAAELEKLMNGSAS